MLQSTLLRAPTSTRTRRYLSELLGRAQMSIRLSIFSSSGALKAARPVRFCRYALSTLNNSLEEPSVQPAYALFFLNCAHFVAPCGTLAILCLRRPIARLSSAWSALSFEDQQKHLTLQRHANSAPLNINADHCL